MFMMLNYSNLTKTLSKIDEFLMNYLFNKVVPFR